MRIAYITIDDAPGTDTVRKASVLASKGIRGIFFCQGQLIEKYRDVALQVVSAGHVIGNHSFNHPHFSRLSLDAAKEQVLKTESLITGIYDELGLERPARLFRFPYGDKGTPAGRDALQEFLRGDGFHQLPFEGITHEWYLNAGLDREVDMFWTFDPQEWHLVSKYSNRKIKTLDDVLDRLARHFAEIGLESNEIVIMHDFSPIADTFVPILDAIESTGFLLAGYESCGKNVP